MEFFELIRRRRSICAYSSAPSAGNLQTYDVFAVEREWRKRELARADSAASGAPGGEGRLLHELLPEDLPSMEELSPRG